MSDETCGWSSDLPEFARTPPRVIRLRLNEFVREAGESQIRAWDRSIPWLQQESIELINADESAKSYTAILEYTLPLEDRRPDLIILENGAVVVIELKGKDRASPGDVDQASAYARDLRNYHRECHGRRVKAVLVPEQSSGLDSEEEDVRVVSKEGLDRVLREYATEAPGGPLTPGSFLRPDAYSPLPSLVQSARLLFTKSELPRIHRARAATQPAIDRITAIAKAAHATGTRRLVLLTGLPGSGKTLVGLQLVHAPFLDDLAVTRSGAKSVAPAVFLSGNDPLVAVLQHALKQAGGDGKVFVRRVRDYRRTYSRPSAPPPPEHVLVFDEAQRAFDEGFLRYKHRKSGDRGPAPSGSEPEQFVRFAERVPGWSVVVALIGSGQEIFSGEDGGVLQWRTAVESAPTPGTWVVHAAADLRDVFTDSRAAVEFHRELNLNSELRFHAASDFHRFVEHVLLGMSPTDSAAIAHRLHEAGMRLRICRNLEVARRYARDRYESNRGARFGLIASSKDKLLPDFGVPNHYAATKFPPGPWFNSDADAEESCRRLARVATEFGVQGLELDLAILAWGSDYARSSGDWSVAGSGGYKYPVRDPKAIRRNVYRVLLTRGRDGTVVFVPPTPSLDETYEFLRASGFRPISDG